MSNYKVISIVSVLIFIFVLLLTAVTTSWKVIFVLTAFVPVLLVGTTLGILFAKDDVPPHREDNDDNQWYEHK